jgi:hypothetical protein
MKLKVCNRCQGTAFRRVNREGFLQQVVYPYFGFYPWECVMCRRKVYFRDEGRRPRRKKEVSEVAGD